MEKKNFSQNIYFRLFLAFFKLGLFTFGGGVAMVPLLQDKVCKEYGWMTEEEVVDCLAVSQGLPGVIAINMATYTGYFMRGLRGALAATFGMVLPSFIIIILVVCILEGFNENPYVQGALTGINAASAGLSLWAAIKLGRQVLKSAFAWILAIGAFLAIAVLDINAVWAILAGIAIGILYSTWQNTRSLGREEAGQDGGGKA